jgi:tryptophan 2,3-dioxygenase
MTTMTDASERLTYGSYLHVPELLTLQRELSQPPHHDELLFIVSHQVYELWFKQMLHEVGAVCAWLDRDEPLRAAQLFDRTHAILHLLVEQIPLLETMFAVDFVQFRDNLRPASGFQSVQFRKLEFLCGAKNPRMIDRVGEDDESRLELAAALRQPTLYDHFLRHLARSGFAIPAAVLERDVTLPHQADEGVLDALVTLYRDAARHYPQFRLAEHLLQLDERFAIWRFHHVKMVERMIGSRAGTGGSSGAKYLAATLGMRFFPEIWQVRDRLTAGYGGG